LRPPEQAGVPLVDALAPRHLGKKTWHKGRMADKENAGLLALLPCVEVALLLRLFSPVQYV
jgi:hypothetical protein